MSLLSAPVVDSAWLQEHLGDVIIADVRWGMAEGAKRQDYLAEHLPGAVFVDLDVDMSAPPGATGRHPLPDPASFAAAMGRLGIGDSSTVVAYDDAAGVMAAARLWYTIEGVVTTQQFRGDHFRIVFVTSAGIELIAMSRTKVDIGDSVHYNLNPADLATIAPDSATLKT